MGGGDRDDDKPGIPQIFFIRCKVDGGIANRSIAHFLGGIHAGTVQFDLLLIHIKADHIHLFRKGYSNGQTNISKANQGKLFFSFLNLFKQRQFQSSALSAISDPTAAHRLRPRRGRPESRHKLFDRNNDCRRDPQDPKRHRIYDIIAYPVPIIQQFFIFYTEHPGFFPQKPFLGGAMIDFHAEERRQFFCRRPLGIQSLL